MKHEKLHLPGGTLIETSLDSNGRYWIGYVNGGSMFFRSVADLRSFLRLSSASRASLDSWLSSLGEPLAQSLSCDA